jgi:two-component system chemotaxis sensor kinase CheA
MSAPIDFDQLRHVFVDECYEGLDSVAESLIELETNPSHPDARDAIFRVAHTVKGGASIVGFKCVAEYAHLFEDALEPLRAAVAPVTPLQITLLLQATDALRAMVFAEASGRDIRIRESDRAILRQLALAVARNDDAPARTSSSATIHDTSHEYVPAADRQAQSRALRVGMDKLDTMLTLSGEIAVAKQRLQQQLESNAPREEALFAAEELDRVLAELQERVMQLRLVELGPVFRPLARTVRDIATVQGKRVRLVTEGDDVEVDASIVQQLRDPLLHMIRNAVDHGIESPAERERAGKPECATIRLRAAHERGTVVISVEDDGAGLRRERILARALERGLVAADAVLSDSDVHALILQPGFSTASTVTQLSGRGVGMDVVRQNVEALRGSLSVRSEEGAGTSISISVPLTIAIIDGFVVGVGDERYVIPGDAICECITLPPSEPATARDGVLNVRGAVLPYARLGALFGTAGAATARESLVVVQHNGKQFGLVVDTLIGERQAVLKPLHRLFDRVPGVSGSTILGDGRVSLILDVPHLYSVLESVQAIPVS